MARNSANRLIKPGDVWRITWQGLDRKLHFKTLPHPGGKKNSLKAGSALTWQVLPSSVLWVPATTLSGKFITLFFRNSSVASSDATTSVTTGQTQLSMNDTASAMWNAGKDNKPCWKLGPSLSRDLRDLTPLEHWTDRERMQNQCEVVVLELYSGVLSLNRVFIYESVVWIRFLQARHIAGHGKWVTYR